VASKMTVSTRHLTNQLAIASKSEVKQPHERKGCSARPGGTAAQCSAQPISTAPALGLVTCNPAVGSLEAEGRRPFFLVLRLLVVPATGATFCFLSLAVLDDLGIMCFR